MTTDRTPRRTQQVRLVSGQTDKKQFYRTTLSYAVIRKVGKQRLISYLDIFWTVIGAEAAEH